MDFILDQLTGVLWFLVFKRHGMDDALNVLSCLLALGVFREFHKRASPWNEHVDQFAAQGSGNAPKGTDCDTVFGLGSFKLLNSLSRCVHFLADLSQAEAKCLAHGGEPSIRRARWKPPSKLKDSVQL